MRPLLAVFTLAVAVPALAQQERLPNDTELHAAACIPVMQWAVDFSHQAVAETGRALTEKQALPPERRPSGDFPEQLKSSADQILAASESTLDRLRAYLLPRLASLDAFAIAAAAKRGQSDVQEITAHIERCNSCAQHAAEKNPQHPDYSSCRENECKRTPVLERLESCKHPTWLPF